MNDSAPRLDKGIPVPPQSHRPVLHVYPLRNMEVGDSFFTACAPREARRARARIHGACAQMKRRKAVPATIKLRIHAVIENEVHGIRTWRVE